MAVDGKGNDDDLLWLTSAFAKAGLPQPPDITSDRVKDLLSRGLLRPDTVTHEEVQELSASVVHHLTGLSRN